MKNQNKTITEISKSARLRSLVGGLIGVWVILFVVLGCSFSKFEFGKKTTTGNSSKRNVDQTNDENLPLKERIIGKWEAARGSEKITMNFTSDEITMNMGGKNRPARYKVVDEETIEISGNENGRSFTDRLRVKFSGGKMTMFDPSGKDPMEFTRVGENDSSEKSINEDSSDRESSSSTDSTESDEDRKLRNHLDGLSRQFIRAEKIVDKAELEKILADDFSISYAENGKNYNKIDFIKTGTGDKTWISSESTDSRFITKEENRVVLGHRMIIKYSGETEDLECKSEFVKRDKWQLRRFCIDL